MTDAEHAETSQRKADHLRITLHEDVQAKGITAGFDAYHFHHQALPEIDLAEVDPSRMLFGRRVGAPLLISSMTGGAEHAAALNQALAEAAQVWRVPMGVGSQRAAIEHAELAPSFQVRRFAPDVPLFANLGAVQLNYGYGVDECRRAVDMVQADALILHFNALQEAVQPHGNTNFAGLLGKIEQVCRQVGVPVIAKEIGHGIAADVAQRLQACGVAAIDVGGAGGTSWSEVESHRAARTVEQRAAASFAGWGIPTTQAIVEARRALGEEALVFGSGGVRNGIDVAKAIALGADVAGLALPFLKAAEQDAAAGVGEALEQLIRELRIAMFCIGARTLTDLQHTPRLVPVASGQ